ncbi:hypothetical protein [Sulfitobacter sp. PM12]|uniref:hypothetical protein n=1 Tax=Sulfitobacter sp. PM12 TaxID=3138497 RepID=UPI0038909672
MSDNRREALEALRDKVKSGEFDRWSVNGAPLTAPQKAFVTRAYHGSLDAAKALHDAVLPGWDWRAEENVNGYVSHIGPAREEFMPSIMAISFESAARAWLLSILSALISETPKGETQ